MPVSGVVIVCGDTEAEVVRALADRPELVVGDIEVPGRLPVVIDTKTHDEHRRQLRWLRELPGVSMVELAFAGYDEPAVVAEPNETQEHQHDAD